MLDESVTFGNPSEERRQMIRAFFRHADSKEELENMALLYVLDPTYARADIMQVISEVERERGWK